MGFETLPSTLVLAGCVRAQRAGEHPARELYDSQLWGARRGYAERAGCAWLILSAGHGLVHPLGLLGGYDASPTPRDWALRCRALAPMIALRFGLVEIHAGARYAKPLAAELDACGVGVVLPMEGLGIGQQLARYNRLRRDAAGVRS